MVVDEWIIPGNKIYIVHFIIFLNQLEVFNSGLSNQREDYYY